MHKRHLTASAFARVAAIAEQIKSAHSPEIEQMEAMLADLGEQVDLGEKVDGAAHGGGDSAGMAGHGGMMSDADMDALMDATGADVARLYLEGMVMHHQGAIKASVAGIAEMQPLRTSL